MSTIIGSNMDWAPSREFLVARSKRMNPTKVSVRKSRGDYGRYYSYFDVTITIPQDVTKEVQDCLNQYFQLNNGESGVTCYLKSLYGTATWEKNKHATNPDAEYSKYLVEEFLPAAQIALEMAGEIEFLKHVAEGTMTEDMWYEK